MQLILDLVQERLPDESVGEAEWLELLALAEEQHVLPWVVKQLRKHNITLPVAACAELLRAERDAVVASFLQASELKGLLHELSAAGIAAIPLKGPPLAQRLYDDVSMRMSRDLDLLVRRRDLLAAGTLLKRLDFEPESMADDYHQSWRRGASLVELHFDVENPLAINFGIEAAWRRARLGSFRGEPAWEFDPADELLFLCLHGVRHRIEYLGLVLDIAHAVRAFSPALGPTYPLERVERDAHMVLLVGLKMASRLLPESASLLSIPASLKDQKHGSELAAKLWQNLLNRPVTPLDWQAQHQFFLELERSPARRIRRRIMHLRILAGRLIGPDIEFAASFGLHRRWQAWVLRPLRLVVGRLSKLVRSDRLRKRFTGE